MLKIQGLTKKFGNNLIFRDLNLRVNANQIIGIYGGSGSGKTSLFNLLSGIDTAHTGQIYLGNHSLNNLSPKQRQKLGLNASDFHSEEVDPDKSVRENLHHVLALNSEQSPTDILLHFLHFGFNNDKEHRVNTILQHLNLQDHHDILCKELDTLNHKLVKLAKIFLQDWRILILEGLSRNLTDQEKQTISIHLEKLKTFNQAIILIENDLEFLQDTAHYVFEMFQTGLKEVS